MKPLRIGWAASVVFAFVLFLTTSTAFALNVTPQIAGDDLKLQLVFPDKIPRSGTFWSLQRTHYPPSPLYAPFLRELNTPVYLVDAARGVYVVDDSKVDYDAIYKARAEEKAFRKLQVQYGLMSEAEYAALEGEGGGMAMMSYSSADLWLEITPNTNVNYVNLTLHNTHSNLYYQIHSTTGLEVPDWIPGEISTNGGGSGTIVFAPVVITNSPKMFFRAVASDTLVAILPEQHAFEASVTNGTGAELGFIRISRTNINGDISQSINIPINISGTASNGVDYLDYFTFPLIALTNFHTIDVNREDLVLGVDPQEDDLIEMDETITVRFLVTNNYVIDPLHYQATITVSDAPEKLFIPVAQLNANTIGIDYYSPSNSLLVSLGEFASFNFMRVDASGFTTNWSGISGIDHEIKIAVAHSTANGFTNGAMYYGDIGMVGVVSAFGTSSNVTWAAITNSSGGNPSLWGSLHVDQSGSFGGKLLVVSGGNGTNTGGGVWSVSATGGVTEIANIPDNHLEGLTSLTNDVAKWGPWAGKLLTGNEYTAEIFAISTNGVVMTNHLDIQPEDFDLITTNQNLYCAALSIGVLKLPSSLFTNYVGDLLVTQEGHVESDIGGIPILHLPKLIVLHWDGTNFVQRASISRRINELLEHSTFAPMDIPRLP
jgi:hypothetical protein